jgi:hypothetical protein
MMPRMVRSARLVAFTAALTVAAPAFAGRMQFGWLYDTDTLPQRGVELETWLQEENVVDDESTLWWFAPLVGITDRFELAIPLALKVASNPTGSTFGFDRYGAELRVKLTNPDPVEAGPFAVLMRAGAFRVAQERSTARLEAGAVFSLDVSRVHFGLDAEFVCKVGDQPFDAEIEPGLGVNVRIVDQLRLGAESAASIHLTGLNPSRWVAAGPNLSWTYGRFWVSGGFLIGIYGIRTAPRINFAVAF